MLPDAPVADGVVIPEDCSLNSQGVGQRIKRHDDSIDRIFITRTPVFISARFVNLADGTECIQLTWLRDGKWKRHIVARAVIAATRSITDLANLGLPVTCKNAGSLIEYLADFEAVNLMALPRAQVPSRWVGRALTGGWGSSGAGSCSSRAWRRQAIDLDSLPLDGCNHELVAFRGADAGDEQIADALRSCGSFEAWARGINEVVDYPRVLVGSLWRPGGTLAPHPGLPQFHHGLVRADQRRQDHDGEGWRLCLGQPG